MAKSPPPPQVPDPSLVLKQTVRSQLYLHHTRLDWYSPMENMTEAKRSLKDYEGIPEVRIIEQITRVTEIDRTPPVKKPCKDCPPEVI